MAKGGRPRGVMTARRLDVLAYLVDARTRGERVSLSTIQRACCLCDRPAALRLVVQLRRDGLLNNTPSVEYLPTRKAATMMEGGNDIRRSSDVGRESGS